MRQRRFRPAYAIPLLLAALCLIAPPQGWPATSTEIETFISNIESSDEKVRHEAFENEAALIGPAAIEPLAKPLASADKSISRAAKLAMEKIVLAATAPGAEPKRQAATEALLNLTESNYPAGVRKYALKMLALAGRDDAIPALVELLKDKDVRMTALRALERIPGPATGRALADAITTVDADFKCAVIKAAGANRSLFAVKTLIQASSGTDVEVRMEARDALARIGHPRAEEVIESGLKSNNVIERDKAFDAYLRLADAVIYDADRALGMYHHALELSRTDAERAAAVTGIGRVGKLVSIKQLVGFLDDPSPVVRDAAARGLIKMPGHGPREMMLGHLRRANATTKAALLRVLAAKDAPETLAEARKARNSKNRHVRDTALELLGELKDMGSESILLEEAQSGSASSSRRAALRAYLMLADARLKNGEQHRALGMYHQALDLAENNEERWLALQGVIAIADPSSLPRVKKLLDVPGLYADALNTYLTLGDALAADGNREKALEVYRDALNRTSHPPVMMRAAEGLSKFGVKTDIAERTGFITDWYIIGPFPIEHEEDWNTRLFPENKIDLNKGHEVGYRTLVWIPRHTDDPQGIVDLAPLMQPNEHVATYAYARVDVDEGQRGGVMVGSDDGVVLWLNGEKVHENNVQRALSVDEDVKLVRFVAGTNHILLKILQAEGDWEYCLRLIGRGYAPFNLEQVEPGHFRAKKR